MKDLVGRHPLLTYYCLSFALSWGAILLAVRAGPGGFSATPSQFQSAVPVAVPAMLLGPVLAAVVVTAIVAGRAGFRDWWSRLARWRVAGRWYAVAALTAPLVIGSVLLVGSLVSADYVPRIVTAEKPLGVFLVGLAVGVPAAFFEEFGWTGFVTPRMRALHGVLATGLIIGILWGAWHLPVNYWASGVTSGQVGAAAWWSLWLLGIFVGQLTAFRVLMVWLYQHTEGSLLLAMLMHASLAASSYILFNPEQPTATLVAGWVTTAVLWCIVAAVILTSHHRPAARHRTLTDSRRGLRQAASR